jgi:hypothetical protein
MSLENGEHGVLVQQILDTKKELEERNKPDTRNKIEIERENGLNDLSRQRERESTQREVQKLKDSIQVRRLKELF